MKRRTLLSGLLASPFLAGLASASSVSTEQDLHNTLVTLPRNQLQLWVVEQIRQARLSKPQLIKALLSAGVSHIEPRPVGFKYHAVLMVDAARRLALNADGIASWIPLLWNVDYFKHSQARSRNISGWMLEESQNELPDLSPAIESFAEGMQLKSWQQVDSAITRLARSGSLHGVFELMLPWAIRDFHSIGHKVILLSGVFRCLEYCGWRDSETILRGTAFALLADGNVAADRRDGWWTEDYQPNLVLSEALPERMFQGEASAAVTAELLTTIRSGDVRRATEAGAMQLRQGAVIQSVWDAVFLAAADAVMNRPTIPMLHCVTVSHGFYSLWQRTGNPVLRRLIPLQAISYVARMKGERREGSWNGLDILHYRERNSVDAAPHELHQKLGSELGYDPQQARSVLQQYPLDQHWWLLKRQLNNWLLYKANKAHDFKYGAAVLETIEWLSPNWRNAYLVACSRLLMGSNMPDSVEGQKIEEWLGGVF